MHRKINGVYSPAAEELRRFRSSKPIYVAIRGGIYDVTSGKSFYGPGGAYCFFAEKDANHAVPKMSKEESDVVPNLDGLTEKGIGMLDDWEKKSQAKYPVAGTFTNWRGEK